MSPADQRFCDDPLCQVCPPITPLHSDSELVRRWLKSQRPAKRGGTYLASKVQRQFSVGRTSARAICARHGFDPDLMVLRQCPTL